MIGLRRFATVGLLASVAAGAACAPPRGLDPEQHLATYDAVLRVQPDGALEVTEDFAFAAASSGNPFVRRVPIDGFDRVDRVAAREGDAATHALANADRSGGLEVSLPMPSSGTGARIELTYRVEGSVAVRGGRGVLTWHALPQGQPFAIAAASVEIILPDALSAVVDPPAPAEGWTVAPIAHGWRFAAAHVPARAPATVTAELTIDPNAVLEPEWQALQTRTHQLMPAFVSAALAILATGAGIVFMIRWQLALSAPSRTARELSPAAAGRGLVVTGWLLIVCGLAGALVTWRWFTFFGIWPVVVPLSVALVGLAFIPEGVKLRGQAAADRRP